MRVVNVISGEVGTNILKRDATSRRKIPEDSLYSKLGEDFVAHVERIPGWSTHRKPKLDLNIKSSNDHPGAVRVCSCCRGHEEIADRMVLVRLADLHRTVV